MIPYIETPPPISIGSWRVEVFDLLVATAVVTGHFHYLTRAKRLGIAASAAARMSLWACTSGFVGSHLLKLLYNPEILAFRGWKGLIDIFSGMSSFGGLLGALAGIALHFRVYRTSIATQRRMVDAVAYVFPFSWIFGRLGCALGHDHPGVRGAGPLTVAFPEGPRYDLGLLELGFTVMILAPLFVWLDRKPRFAGFYPALLFTVYGAFRILLDRLHESPPTYLGVAMDQWAGAASICAGVWFLARWRAPAIPSLLP